MTGGCNHEIEDQANPQVDHVDVLPADDVGGRRPDEAPAHVGQRQQPDEPGGGRGGQRRVVVLHHRRGVFQNADAGGDVAEQDHPQAPELRRANRVIRADIRANDGDLRRLHLQLRRARRSPIRVRQPDAVRTKGDDQQVHHRKRDKRRFEPRRAVRELSASAERLHQPVRGRRRDERATAETHDC